MVPSSPAVWAGVSHCLNQQQLENLQSIKASGKQNIYTVVCVILYIITVILKKI